MLKFSSLALINSLFSLSQHMSIFPIIIACYSHGDFHFIPQHALDHDSKSFYCPLYDIIVMFFDNFRKNGLLRFCLLLLVCLCAVFLRFMEVDFTFFWFHAFCLMMLSMHAEHAGISIRIRM